MAILFSNGFLAVHGILRCFLTFLRVPDFHLHLSHAFDSSANDYAVDLRDPSIVPLNFTKSINLALSERGLYAMKQSGEAQLVDHVMSATIPMRGRMIHGQSPNGSLYEHSQNYGVDDQVRKFHNQLDVTHYSLIILRFVPKYAQSHPMLCISSSALL